MELQVANEQNELINPGSLIDFQAQMPEAGRAEAQEAYSQRLEEYRQAIIKRNVGSVGIGPLIGSAGRNDG